jgi:outer membrane protein OmpA-like peptidoglycan-associated protein
LVFSSNTPGGYGGHDLYMSRLQENTWSKPENMGPAINTAKDEMFPTWIDEHTLYFSSNGHPGFGALDLFVSYYKGNKWRKPVNLLPPINSGGDDMTMHFDPASEGSAGYFSSNRLGRGDDLFYFEVQTPEPCRLCGTVYDHKTKKPLARASVLLYDRLADTRYYVETDDKGQYCIQLPYEKEYRLDAYFQYYTNKNEPAYLSTVGLAFAQNFKQDFYLTKWTVDEVKIEGILYDLDKADLRPESKLVLDSLGQLLQLHYYLVVELSSHTDCRGTASYNEALSQRRAESCVNYLTAMGIDPGRLVAKGYGEGRLLNDCACEDEQGLGLTCPESLHQANRRTSFQIMRTDFEPQNVPDFGLPWPGGDE